jgi:signal transduction histidine kinase
MHDLIDAQFYILNPYSVGPIVVALLSLTLGFLLFSINRKDPFHQSFFICSILIGLWLASSSLVFNSFKISNALFWSRLLFMFMMMVPASVYHLSAALTRNTDKQKNIIRLVYAQGAIFALLSWNSHFIAGIYRTVYGIYPQAGLLFPVLIFFIGATFLLTFMNLMYFYFFQSTSHEKKEFGLYLFLFSMVQLGFVDVYSSYDANIYPSGFIALFGFVLMLSLSKLKWYVSTLTETNSRYENKIAEKIEETKQLNKKIKFMEQKSVEGSRIASVAHLSAGILHQISQPVTAINGFVKFIKKEMPPKDTFYRPISLVEEQCVYLKQMLEDLMALVKHRELKRMNISVHTVLHKVTNLIKDEMRIRRINWDLDLIEGIPPVYVDPIELQQVFLCVLINAMDALSAMPRDYEKYIRISTRFVKEKGEIEVAFKDTGPGIPVEDEQTIFEPFYSTKVKNGGVGLALCRTLLMEQGGRIFVERSETPGALFVIRLPAIV